MMAREFQLALEGEGTTIKAVAAVTEEGEEAGGVGMITEEAGMVGGEK